MKRPIASIVLFIMTLLVASAQAHFIDWDAATQRATTENKRILMIFSGSDW